MYVIEILNNSNRISWWESPALSQIPGFYFKLGADVFNIEVWVFSKEDALKAKFQGREWVSSISVW